MYALNDVSGDISDDISNIGDDDASDETCFRMLSPVRKRGSEPVRAWQSIAWVLMMMVVRR